MQAHIVALVSRNEPADPALDADAQPGAATPAPPEQGEPEAPAAIASNTQPKATDPSTSLLQAEYTKSQQRWAELRKRFDLPRDATPEDIIAAVEAARAAAAPRDDEDPETRIPDRKALEAEARAEAAEWRLQSAIYPTTADAAREYAEFARQERDPEALTQKFYELLQRFAEAPAQAGDPAPAATAAGDAGGGVPSPRDFEVGEGDPAVAMDAAAFERLRGSGRVAEGLRGIPGLGRLIGRAEG